MTDEIKIIYEDNDIVAVDKPAGLAVHGDCLNQEPTLADWLVEYYPAAAEVGEPIRGRDGSLVRRPGIVHRLDKATSGVMVMVKNQPAYQIIKDQFLNRQVTKVYYLLTHGRPADQEGVIDQPIGRHPKDPRRRLAGSDARGTLRPAVTYFTVLEYFSATKGAGWALIEARPQTGRMHQLRVHFKYLDLPIVGDTLYAPGRPSLTGLDRLALHAGSLTLTLPAGAVIKLEAELALDISLALENLRRP